MSLEAKTGLSEELRSLIAVSQENKLGNKNASQSIYHFKALYRFIDFFSSRSYEVVILSTLSYVCGISLRRSSVVYPERCL